MTEETQATGMRHIESWQDWLQRWSDAETFEESLGLLQCGLSVGNPSWEGCVERWTFYLSLADGHLLKRHERDDSDDLNALRRKAFEVLATKVFKFSPGSIDHRVLWETFAIEALTKFFRTEKKRLVNVRMGGHGYNKHDEWAGKFALAMARSLFKYAYPSLDQNRLLLARVNFLPIFGLLGSWFELLDFYKPQQSGAVPNKWFEDCFQFISVIALEGRHVHPFAEEEAMLDGSDVAAVLLLLRIKREEAERQRLLKDAEKRAAEAQAEAEKLRT